MLGAIAGDIIGSPWESAGHKNHDFPLFSEFSRFTDDTVMTLVIAQALLEDGDYAKAMRRFGRQHPFAGYGARFEQWLLDPAMGPYNSYGNGAAMRAAPIGVAATSAAWALAESARCAAVTHDHPEGIAGAQAVALGVFMSRSGASREDIRSELAGRFGYDLARSVGSIRPGYSFDVAAARSVPEAIICFLDSSDFEDAVRNAVSLGGDADTMACIAGAFAQAHFGAVPDHIACAVRQRLPDEFLSLLQRFDERFGK